MRPISLCMQQGDFFMPAKKGAAFQQRLQG